MDFNYPLIDADNHYYEPYDAFTRHLEHKYQDRSLNIRRRPDGLGAVYFGDKPMSYMRVTQSDYMGAPGSLRAFFEGRAEDQGFLMKEIINAHEYPEFMEKSARLALMDKQQLASVIMLPTLAVCVGEEMTHDVEAMYANFRSFNRWLEEDWGFGADGRVFGVPMLWLVDLESALAELDRVLAAGARAINLNAGPAAGRSLADPYYDKFWARIQEAGVLVSFHIGLSNYTDLWSVHWGEPARPAFQARSPFQWFMEHGDRPIMDTMAALILNNLFGRFPGIRVAVLEYGGEWVGYLFHAMDHAAMFGRNGRWPAGEINGKPSEIFKEHVWVAPFPEEDPLALIELIGVDHVLFGSDFPHAEGIAEPKDFADKLQGLPEDDVRKVMRENAAELLRL